MKKLVPYSPTPLLTRVFLVLLRLAIGWHLFVEGSSKLDTFFTGPTGTSKPFSSKGYLLQSQGPLAPYFRNLAGDPDAYTLQMLEKPELLEAQWRDYVTRYSTHYELSADQQAKALDVLKQQLEQLREWFKTGTRELAREYSFASTTPTLTTPVRIAEYKQKLNELRERLDGWNLRFDKDVSKARVTALRGEVAKLRTELQSDLDARQKVLEVELDKLLTEKQQDVNGNSVTTSVIGGERKLGYARYRQVLTDILASARESNCMPTDMHRFEEYPSDFVQETTFKNASFRQAMNRLGKREFAPPYRVEDTRQLELADKVVAWGLTLCGAGLILGLFTRLSALGGACLLLLFFLALPPLPGLPDNPMAEGKYLFVNKNLIEALALLTLATTASGRWLGLDALLSLFPPFKYLWPRPRYVEVG
ncbi:MAG: DoxX family membrane protein [Gemmatales bacterium]